MTTRGMSLSEKLDHYSIPEPNSGCLLWIGPSKRCGYGALSWQGKVYRAHRVAWEIKNGPIPTGMVACHKCDVTACVNPDHVFIATQIENVADMFRKKRQSSGQKHASATALGICERNIASALRSEEARRLIFLDRRPRSVIATEHGVTVHVIGGIRYRYRCKLRGIKAR